jgi:hypothetical protein
MANERHLIFRLTLPVQPHIQRGKKLIFGDDEFIEEIVRVNTEGLQQYESFCRENDIPFYPTLNGKRTTFNFSINSSCPTAYPTRKEANPYALEKY